MAKKLDMGKQPADSRVNEHSVYVLEYMGGATFPATVPELVQVAEDNGAPEGVLDMLQALPDRTYNSVKDLNKGVGLLEPLPDHGHLEASSARSGMTESEVPPGGEGRV